ncbi:MAG: hypothetical protein LKG27_00190 [Clostridiaceae bacterium]|nr:hypothetical protein [Clostridiaceae bacterium]
MKFKILIILTMLFFFTGIANADYVNGYMRRDGTYVQGYNRSTPNETRLDNYSTRGNYNPYTGKEGTVNPYNQYGTAYNKSYENKLYSNNYRNNF